MDLPALGVEDAKKASPGEHQKFHRIISTNNMFDFVKTVHENEVDHAGYKKCSHYVSIH